MTRLRGEAGRGRVGYVFLVVVALLALPVLPSATGTAPLAASPSSLHVVTLAAGLRTSALGSHLSFESRAGSSSFSPFFAVNNSAGAQNVAADYCTRSVSGARSYSYCYPQAQNPTLLSLGNGNLGLGFSAYTSANATSCVGSDGATSGRVGFRSSGDGGATFGPVTYLGNRTCSFLQAIEPSFAVGASGHVYAAFVEENHSAKLYPPLPRDFGSGGVGRGADALGFASSSDNGTTFGQVATIETGGNISRPEVAAFGSSVYIAYENVSNTTVCASLSCLTGIALWLLYSPDSGATWRGPYALPGLGSTWNFTAMSPSIAVSSTGTVGVAYATNRSCVYTVFSFCSVYGEDIVVSQSATNGSSWSGPVTLGTGFGESANYPGYYLGQYFQEEPTTSIAYAPNGTTVYAAWAGTYNHSTRFLFSNYRISGVFAAVSTNGGRTWSNQSIAALLTATSLDSYFDPSVGANASGAYLTYTDYNMSYCGTPPCSPLIGAYSQWVVPSTGASRWGTPEFLSLISESNGLGFSNSWPGYTSDVLSTSSGPRIAYTMVTPGALNRTVVGNLTDFNYAYGTSLAVAQPTPAIASIYLNFAATHLPAGARWGVTVNGVSRSTTALFLNVTGVPSHQFLFLNASNLTLGPLHIRVPALNVPGYTEFNASRNITVNYSADYWGVTVGVGPRNIGFGGGENFAIQAGNDSFTGFGTVPTATPPLPWYFLAGSNLSLVGSGTPIPPLYWVGIGPGNYSGPGTTANVTIRGPLNETMWLGLSAASNITFQSQGLPSTSRFQFDWDGGSHSGPGNGSVVLANVASGGHLLTNVTANATVAGWEYFGRPDVPNPVLAPLTPLVNLSFAAVNLASTPGTISFHANGTPSGSIWELSFNGTVYGSNTSWINVTEHAGAFVVGSFPFTGADGVSHYLPATPPKLLPVVPGGIYQVNFVPAFELTVLASGGGAVTPPSHYVANGTTVPLSATPSANYAFGGWQGAGTGAYSGPNRAINVTVANPVVEVAQFLPIPLARFNLTFLEAGLPAGTPWTVTVNGTGYGGTSRTIVVPNLYPFNAPGGRGSYRLIVAPLFENGTIAAEYVPTGYPSPVSTNGSTIVTIGFVPEFRVDVVAGVGGTVTADSTLGPFNTPAYLANNSFVQLNAFPSTGHSFVAWVGTGSASYSGPNLKPTFNLNGSATETALFAPIVVPPPPTYTLELVLTTPLPAGTTWTAQIGNLNVSSTGSSLNVSGLVRSTYNISVPQVTTPDGGTRFALAKPIAAILLDGNKSTSIAFQPSYHVVVGGATGGTVSSLAGWYRAGAIVFLNASPDPGQSFAGWVGTGVGSYTGSNESVNLTVGGPISEFAEFQATPSTTSHGNSGAASATEWALVGVGAILLVVAALVVVAPKLRRGPPTELPKEAASSTGEEESP
jgi:List-Bact-rpt repeat protein